MAFHLDLQNIITNKPSGDYFLYYDRSLVPEMVSASGLRILIGQSKKGVVNTLTTHDKWDSFKSVYGDIDRSLERNGSFFHRSAFEMLATGNAIGVINLRSFDDVKDKSGKISLASTFNKNNDVVKNVPYTSLFNQERFWKVDPKGLEFDGFEHLLSFANVGSNKKTIFVRKAFDVSIDGSIETYYKNVLNKEVPDSLFGFDNVSDTFVEVYVFNNDFSELTENMSNPSYGYLFDENGVKRSTSGTLSESTDALRQLSKISESGFVKVYKGSLIPDLVDAGKHNVSIVNQINNDFFTVGLVCAINNEAFDEVARWTPITDADDKKVYSDNGSKKPMPFDMVGHTLWETDASGSIDGSIYDGQVIETLSYEKETKLHKTDVNNIKNTDIDLPKDITAIEYDNILFPYTFKEKGGVITTNVNTSKVYMVGFTPIKVGDKFVSKDSNLTSVKKLNYVGKYKILEGLHTEKLPLKADGTLFPKDPQGKYIYPIGSAKAGLLVEFELVSPFRPLDDLGVAIPMPTITDADKELLRISDGIEKNVYLVSFDRPLNVGGVVTNAMPFTGTISDLPKTTLEDSTEIKGMTIGSKIYRQLDIDSKTESYKPFSLKAYKQRAEQFVDNSSGRQSEILTVLSSTLRDALIDRERVDFRYLVDGFASYIDNNLKEHFTSVVKDRNVGACILNAPSINKFRKSKNPYFKNTPQGKFDSEHIYNGGNLELPYTQTFSLASKGANHGYYYAPWFVVDDNGSEIIMPPAPFVSNNYVRKASSGRPYDAIFGVDTGIVGGVNIKTLEYDFTDDDRKWLEKSGINPISFKKSKGNVIMGNRTGLRTNSALKFAHVNELIIQMYEQMRPIALFLLGKYNTAQNRLIVKTRMDTVMDSIMAQGAVQYYENIVDGDINNTEDIISEGLAVMDTVIVPNYVNEKVVYRLTLNRTTEQVTGEIL